MSVLIGLPTTSTLVLPTLTGCRIYVHDVATASGVRLHPRYTPCGWPHVQHADETWLSQALASSPWRVQSVADADLVYLDGHDFSRWCTASRILNMRNTQRRRKAERHAMSGSGPAARHHRAGCARADAHALAPGGLLLPPPVGTSIETLLRFAGAPEVGNSMAAVTEPRRPCIIDPRLPLDAIGRASKSAEQPARPSAAAQSKRRCSPECASPFSPLCR